MSTSTNTVQYFSENIVHKFESLVMKVDVFIIVLKSTKNQPVLYCMNLQIQYSIFSDNIVHKFESLVIKVCLKL